MKKHWKKGMAVLMTCSLTVGTPIGAMATETKVNVNVAETETGTCGENVTWVLDEEGKLTISGTGTKIDFYAFYGNSDIHTVVIEKNVNEISSFSFGGCSNLTEVTIKGKISDIASNAFSDCENLNKITFEGDAPYNVGSISSAAFANVIATVFYPIYNTSWTENFMMNYGGTLTWEGYLPDADMFGSCGENVTWVLDEEGNLLITGSGSIADYTGETPWKSYLGLIKNVVVEEGITHIGSKSFEGASNLKTVTLPDSLTTIGDYAFKKCASLEKISIPNAVRSLGIDAFRQCTNLKEITLPNSLTSIGSSAFQGCSVLTEIVLPDYLGRIESSAFSGCSSLKKVTLPANLYDIGPYAFYGCRSLTKITFPEKVSQIETWAFIECTSLIEMTFEGDAPRISSQEQFETFVGVTATAFYPANNETWTTDKLQNYGGTLTWVPYGEVIESVEIIESPSDLLVELGETATFHVKATGNALKYQWQWSHDGGETWKNSSSVTVGYNTETLEVTATSERQGYQYRCVVTDENNNTVTSATAVLNVNIPFGIVTQPVDKEVKENEIVSFTVKAQGEGLVYQWQWSHDGGETWKDSSSATVGYNKATLYVNATAARNGYQYRCIITDKNMETLQTEVAILNVNIPFGIVTQPEDKIVQVNHMVSFTVKAQGEGLAYQWQWSHDGGETWKDSSSITLGYNTDTLYVWATAARNGYQYRCIITDKNRETLQTEVAVLRLKETVKITTQPIDQSVQVNKMTSFTVKAEGEDLQYQWQWSHNGGLTWKNSSKATIGYDTDTLQIEASAARNGYLYRCVITDKNGMCVLTKAATLYVEIVLSITEHPVNQNVDLNEIACFTVKAEGENLQYQWQWSYDGGSTWKDSSKTTAGYNTDTLYIKGIAARNGYQYRCVMTDKSGDCIVSEIATLNVQGAPVITIQPSDQIADVDSMVNFVVKVEGESLQYQWQWSHNGGLTWKNSSKATIGYNTDTLQVKATAARNGYQYRCIITNNTGVTFITKTVTLRVQ